MMSPLIIPMPGNEAMAASLSSTLQVDLGAIETRQFPDSETYLRIISDLAGRNVAIVCTLDRPDGKLLPLVFAAEAARDLGATGVGLVAPYLAYMRQDRRFNSGEAISSRSFARFLSSTFDWLVTVDPHLHRYASLDELYAIPSSVVRAAPDLADWIRVHIERPLVIGPDSESEQWVSQVASRAGCPYAVLSKRRLGDRHVEIALPDVSMFSGRTPVLVDDIASSARTMIEACKTLTAAGLASPVCVAIHALFSPKSHQALQEVASDIVTTNTVVHETNRIDLSKSLASGLKDRLNTVPIPTSVP